MCSRASDKKEIVSRTGDPWLYAVSRTGYAIFKKKSNSKKYFSVAQKSTFQSIKKYFSVTTHFKSRKTKSSPILTEKPVSLLLIQDHHTKTHPWSVEGIKLLNYQ